MPRPSITYWNRVEPTPRGGSLQPGLAATVRDPLWFLCRQWQLGEFQAEDAASPAYGSVTTRSSKLDGWRVADGPVQPYDGGAPLEAVVESEASTPDLRTAVELGQALERRLVTAGLAGDVVAAFRRAYPVPTPADLAGADRRDPALVRLLRVCGGRATDGVAALTAARAAAPGVPAELALPPAVRDGVAAVLGAFADWARATLGVVGYDDAAAWRADRLEYAFEVSAATGDGARVRLDGHAGRHGEFDWYAFDERDREPDGSEASTVAPVTVSMLPMPVRFSGMPDPRWWNFEDARFDWASVEADRSDLAKVLVVDFMLVQSNDWFMVPVGHEIGTLVRVEQVLVTDVFGEVTLVRRADAATVDATTAGAARSWTMFSTSTSDGIADYVLLPPGALRTTIDGPDVEEVRFVRDEQANLVWAIEAVTEDGTGRPRSGRERATDVPEQAPPPPETAAPLRYRLQTTVPVNWIPFLPVQVHAARRAVALERAAMQRYVDGVVQAVTPAGRVLRPSGLADPDVYRVYEEEVPRSGTRVLRATRRTRWVDGSTHLWTSRRRRAGTGEAASGLRYDVADRTP